MKRNLGKLSDTEYDLLVIGGGINGACVAWDASLRGLSVALVDKGDFGAATSSATGKIIHGGIRFLQYGALLRLRESLHERMVFQKIAPQFVHPIPFFIPTYGHLMQGKEVLSIATSLYDLLSYGKKELQDPEKTIPRHRILSKSETVELEPDIEKDRLTGGVLFHDCQMHSPERLTLAFLLSSNEAGADLANYVKVDKFILNRNRAIGVKASDMLTGEGLTVRAKLILNAAGPWTFKLIESLDKKRQQESLRFSKGIHIVTHPLTKHCALALTTRKKHANALLSRGGRHFFIMPWRNHALIGTTNVPFEGDPDGKKVTETDVVNFLKEIKYVYPPADDLGLDDVKFFYGGLYPDDININSNSGYQGNRKDQIIDHYDMNGIESLISVIGVKYTTARKLAQNTIDLVFKKLGREPVRCDTESKPLYGGKIERFNDFLEQGKSDNRNKLNEGILQNIIYNHGSSYREVLNYADDHSDLLEVVNENVPVIKAQIVHAVRKEMAQKLSDVVFRRTGIGSIGNPGNATLRVCASVMAEELGWDKNRIENELEEVAERYTLS